MTALAAARQIFGLFATLGRKTGKTRVFAILGLIPIALGIGARVVLHGRTGLMADVSTEILMAFFLQFYIVILSLFFGTSVAAEEIENRTLAYLITRPVPKGSIVLGKYAAYSALMFAMVGTSLTVSYVIINAGRLGEAAVYGTFFRYLAVLGLGILAYTAFFTFLGVLLKRSIIVGLIFGFGWEMAIQFFPGSTQRFSIVHFLKSLLPFHPAPSGLASGGRGVALLLFRLEPTSPGLAILALVLITAAFLGLAAWLFRTKEYLYED